MTDKNPPITIYTNEIVQKNLEPILRREELDDFCAFEKHNENNVILRINSRETRFSLPLRIGELVDHIKMLIQKTINRNAANLDLGGGILDTNLGNFTHVAKNRTAIQLTEKEVEILRYLHDNTPRKISRDELLESVWGYAKNTETHTLETHIYRLRRKIETDPVSPVILKKDEDGYFLG